MSLDVPSSFLTNFWQYTDLFTSSAPHFSPSQLNTAYLTVVKVDHLGKEATIYCIKWAIFTHAEMDQNVVEDTLKVFSRDHPSWRLRNLFPIGSRCFETFRHCPPWDHSRIFFSDFERFWSIFVIFWDIYPFEYFSRKFHKSKIILKRDSKTKITIWW